MVSTDAVRGSVGTYTPVANVGSKDTDVWARTVATCNSARMSPAKPMRPTRT
jgi:hypothetical protein